MAENKEFEKQEIISEEETQNLDILDECNGESAELTSGEIAIIAGVAGGIAAAGAATYALATKVVIPGVKKIAANVKEAAEDKKNLTKEEREEKKLRQKMTKLVEKANKEKLAEIDRKHLNDASVEKFNLINELVDKELNKNLDDDVEDFDDDFEESSEKTEE